MELPVDVSRQTPKYLISTNVSVRAMQHVGGLWRRRRCRWRGGGGTSSTGSTTDRVICNVPQSAGSGIASIRRRPPRRTSVHRGAPWWWGELHSTKIIWGLDLLSKILSDLKERRSIGCVALVRVRAVSICDGIVLLTIKAVQVNASMSRSYIEGKEEERARIGWLFHIPHWAC